MVFFFRYVGKGEGVERGKAYGRVDLGDATITYTDDLCRAVHKDLLRSGRAGLIIVDRNCGCRDSPEGLRWRLE